MRWGGLSQIAAGAVGLVASALFAVAALRASEGAFSYAHDRFYVAASFVQGPPRLALLYGARDRERAIVAAEHLALSEENRSKARRSYESAWVAGDLTTVDDLVAEAVLHHEHDRYGIEEFKRTIADLHRTFSDLSLSMEEQTAQHDTVTTRCALSGTDRGGVLWYPPTDKRVAFTATYTDHFSDGGLVEHDGEIDLAALLNQLGIPASV